MGLSIVTYALCKKYVDDSLQGGGALKGKNCTIDDISAITGGNRVTFKWTLDDGTVQSGYMDVMDGTDGQDGQDGAPGQQGPQGEQGPAGNGINFMEIRSINGVSHLILTYTNAPTVEVDCGIIESNGEGKVYHDDDDWTPISFKINDMHPSSFVPNGKKRTIIIDKIAMSINQRRLSYFKVLTPISLNSTKANYNVYLESGHKYFVESDTTYEGYLKEIVDGDNDYHDYSAKKPVIIDLTETFGAGYEPDISTLITMLAGDSGIRNKFYGETAVGWWSGYVSSYNLGNATIKGRKQDGTLVDIEDFSTIAPYVYTNYMGYENLDGEDKSTIYDFVNKQTIYKTHSALSFSQCVITKLTSSTVANEFAYVEDGTKHYLIKKTGYQIYNYGSTDWNAKYNPSLNPSKKLDMRVFFDPNLSFDGISVNDLLNAESSTSENNFNHFAGVSSAQFSDLGLNSSYFYPAWRYDDCNSIKDFFLKWGYDLDALDTQAETELVPYLHFTTTCIAFRDEDYISGGLSNYTVMPALFILKIDEDIVDLHLIKKINTESSSYSPLCLQFIGRELKDGCKESSEDLINSQDVFVTKKDPKAFGSFTLGGGIVVKDVEEGVSFFGGTVNGGRALAAGLNSKALGQNSFAFGDLTEADMGYAVAIGQGCKATKEGAISIGRKHMWADSGQMYTNDQLADGYGSVAIGTGCRATEDFALALIKDSEASGEHSVSIGYNTKSTATSSIAIGQYTQARAQGAVALGWYTQATGNEAFAVGEQSMATAWGATATGIASKANGAGSVAMGNSAQASTTGSVALGNGAKAIGDNSCSIGNNTVASGQYSFARGSGSQATAKDATAIGEQCEALTPNSIAIGNNCKAGESGGDTAIALGVGCQAKKFFSIAVGNTSIANTDNCIAIGNQAKSSDVGTIAIGCSAISNSGQHGICIGDNSTSNNGENVALGYKASALAPDSIAIGTQATAGRHGGIAIGHSTSIGSNQWYSIAIGGGAKVTAGGRGIAIGVENPEVKGDLAVAIGTGSIARAHQVVIGPLNIEDTEDKYAFIVGNGTMNNVAPHNRSNLLTVTKTGVIEATNLPAAPASQGSYVLTCTVDADGNATYSWESTT